MRIFSQYIFFLLLLVCTNASAQVPRGTPTEAYPSGSASLVCELETKKVSYGEPVRVHLEGTRLATKIDYRVITGSQSVEVSGSFSRSAAVSRSSNATSVMVDTSGFRPGSYRLIATAIADGKTTSCEVNFSVFYATAARPTENYQRVKLFFATDRATGETQGDVQTFTSSRAENGSLKFGTAEVSIPRDHRMGELERPSLLRLEFREDPEKHIVLLKATTLNEDVFLKELQARINSDPQKEVLIFIHGYSVTFEEAARRLGQITYDLGFAGAPILYSWPSQGTIFGYTADEATIEWVIPHFENFLHFVAEQTGASTMYVIAHSMGNRAVSGALKALADKGQTLKPKLKEIVMAAPDIDAGVFQQLASAIQTTGGRFTIYESSKDLALEASHRFHGFARLGDTNPTVHVFDGYDCIEATGIDTGFLGHSYVMESGSILGDIFELFKGKDPASRFRLAAMRVDGKSYWSFRK